MTAPTTDPERALIGAVEHMQAEPAARVLALLREDDLADPRMRVVAEVARQLAEKGVAPDPTAIVVHARASGTVTRVEAVRNFALLVIDLYAECPTPASASYYFVATLAEAVRRRCAEAGVRLTQAADGASLDALVELVDAEARAIRELAERRDAAAGTARPRLAAVPGVSA